MKKQNGITLIALVITIIVLLILAGVSISLVLGDNGILNQAKKSVKDHSEAEIIEQIKLAHSAYEMAKAGGSTESAQKYISDRLKEVLDDKNLTVSVSEETGEITVSVNARGETNKYKYNPQDGNSKKIAEWKNNGDWTWTHSETGTTLKLGDVVNYDELSHGVKTYAVDISKGIGGGIGEPDDMTKRFSLNSKTYTTDNLTWRVLGVNEKGKIELISENPISEDVYIANEEGYCNIETKEDIEGVLDIMCDDLYGKGNGAESARSLNINDIDKLSGIKNDIDKKNCTTEYGYKWQYRYPTEQEESENRRIQSKTDPGSGYGNWLNKAALNCQTFRLPGTAVSTRLSNANPGCSPELMHTYYEYGILSRVTQIAEDGLNIANLLCKGTTDSCIKQLLASGCVYCNNDHAMFGIRIINDNKPSYRSGWTKYELLYTSEETCYGARKLLL